MTAQTTFDDQQSFANTALASAEGFISDLQALAVTAEFDIGAIPDGDYVNLADGRRASSSVSVTVYPSVPAIVDPDASVPTFVEPEIDSPDQVTVPDFDRAAPQLEIPAAPSAALPSVPAQPTIDDPVMPTAPELSFPTAPVIVGVTLPEMPSVSIPDFTTSAPIDDLVAPTASFDWAEEIYESELLDETKAKLLDAIQNGGYGIETADEQALWDRARDREIENALMEQEQIYSAFAARGFALPPGELNLAVHKSIQNLANKLSGLSRDIAIKRGDLYVENRKFTIQEIRQLESVLINYHMSRMERSLNAAKLSLDFSIQLFNALVGRYNARLAGYQAEAAVFAERIRAQQAVLEAYRTQMQGKQIETDIQRAQVEVYRAQLEGVNTQVAIYKARVDAAAVFTEVQQAKVATFRAMVEAYAAQVQAKVAEFNMFESRIRGETAKVDAFKAEVDAFAAEVGAAEAKARIASLQVEASVKTAEVRLSAYKADIDRYSTELQAQIAVINAHTSRYSAELQAFESALNESAEDAKAKSQAWFYEQEIKKKNADISMENARLSLAKLKTQYDIQMTATTAAAKYYGDLIGAAQSALTAVASVSG